jgi:hypothetical protein
MIDLKTNIIDLNFFKKILKGIKNSHQIENLKKEDIIDSFSNNQFNSKGKLLELIDNLNILTTDSTVAIYGCWFGSILIPVLSPKVKKIVAIDLDNAAIRLARDQFFINLDNVNWLNVDAFAKCLEDYTTTTLFINTSCEHMPSMKTWPWWSCLENNAYFAFQSNNMYQIAGHINCVSSLEEFKTQLPSNFEVLFEDELEDERGTRYTLVGRIATN